MQLAILIAKFTISSLFFCLCNGAPPREKGESSSRRTGYSPDEEQFIIDELERHPVHYIPIWSKPFWNGIAKSHSKARESDPSRFPPRTDNALRCHFQKYMLTSQGVVPVPDTLRKRFPEALKRKAGTENTGDPTCLTEDEILNETIDGKTMVENTGRRSSYSHDEEQFIIDEIARHPVHHIPIWSKRFWNKIELSHSKARESDPSRFPPRTDNALRCHFQKYMLNSPGVVPLPDTLINRLPEGVKKQRDDDPNSRYLTEEEIFNETQDDEMDCRRPHQHDTTYLTYSADEDEFLFMTARSNCRKKRARGVTLWDVMAEKFREMHESNPFRFPYDRTARSLRWRFETLTRGSIRPLRRRANFNTPTESEDRQASFSNAEDNFIFEELLKPTCTSMYSLSVWKRIKAQHDHKVKSKTPGFELNRTLGSLRSHLLDKIWRDDRLPSALKKKFERQFSETPDHARSEFQRNQASSSREVDSAFWSDMIDELLDMPDSMEEDLEISPDE